MPEDLRQHLRERFDAWLDEVLATPEPPSGVAAELLEELLSPEDDEDGLPAPRGDDEATDDTRRPPDLFALHSALLALRQEVRLQGRGFRRLSDEIASLTDLAATVEEMRESQTEALAGARQVAEQALERRRGEEQRTARELERRVRREGLELLLDLADRMRRGLETARAHLAAVREPRLFGRRAWRGHRAAAEAVAQGQALSLERLDEELGRLGVRKLESLGRPFDPHTMTVLDVEEVDEASATPDGTVLEVYRPGYVWRDELLRPAQVKVARTRQINPLTS